MQSSMVIATSSVHEAPCNHHRSISTVVLFIVAVRASTCNWFVATIKSKHKCKSIAPTVRMPWCYPVQMNTELAQAKIMHALLQFQTPADTMYL